MDGSKRLWVLPLLLVAMIAGFVGYRYRYLVPAFRPNTSGAPQLFDLDARIDASQKHIIVFARNYRPVTIGFTIQDARWNNAPMLDRLPKSVSIPPYGEKQFRLKPIDERVASYGDCLIIDFRYSNPTGYGYGKKISGKHGGQPAIQYTPFTASDIELYLLDWPYEVEVRNVRLVTGKKVLSQDLKVQVIRPDSRLDLKSPVNLAKKPFSVLFDYRVSPWSKWVAESYDMDEP